MNLDDVEEPWTCSCHDIALKMMTCLIKKLKV